MKRHFAQLVLCFTLAAARSFAREPQAPPSPPADGAAAHVGTIKEVSDASEGSTRSIYVGHYGEAVEFPYGWTAEPSMRGLTEAVYFHRKSDDLLGLHPFQPKESDYKPENFAAMRLIELVVVPKNAPGGLRDLKALRGAKEKELTASGADYEIIDEMSEPYFWPHGSFHVEIKRPYRLRQTYSESATEFYILTAGGRLKEGDYSLSNDRILNYNFADALVSGSLGRLLLSVHTRTPGGLLFKAERQESNDFMAPFKLVRLRVVLGLFSTGMLILALWPGTSQRVRRAHLFGYSLLFFTLLTALAGFLSVYIPVHCGGVLWRNSAAAGLIPVLLIPWISWIAARRFGSAHPRRILFWSGALAVLLTLDLFRGSRLDSATSADNLAYGTTLLLLVLGLAFGLTFAVAFGPLPQKEEKR